MSSSNFSISDIRFHRRLAEECDIVVFDETVGTVTKRPDIADPHGAGVYFALHLFDDHHGPVLVDHRDAVKPTLARMLVDRNLAPVAPPPVHPEVAGQRQHHA